MIEDMVSKQLETFETYKLQGAQGCLKFASNFLTKINLHRAECLDSLVVYAPRLEKLSLFSSTVLKADHLCELQGYLHVS